MNRKSSLTLELAQPSLVHQNTSTISESPRRIDVLSHQSTAITITKCNLEQEKPIAWNIVPPWQTKMMDLDLDLRGGDGLLELVIQQVTMCISIRRVYPPIMLRGRHLP